MRERPHGDGPCGRLPERGDETETREEAHRDSTPHNVNFLDQKSKVKALKCLIGGHEMKIEVKSKIEEWKYLLVASFLLHIKHTSTSRLSVIDSRISALDCS